MLRGKADIVSILLLPITFFIVFKSSSGIGYTWDEATYLKQTRHMVDWVKESSGIIKDPVPGTISPIGKGKRKKPFDVEEKLARNFEKHWKEGDLLEKQNPPFSQEVQSIFYIFFKDKLGDVRALRLATIVLFSIAAVLIFRMGKWAGGWTAGIAAYGFIMTMPRVMGHAGIAATDSITMSMGFITASLWLRYANSGRGAILTAVFVGWTLLTKISVAVMLPMLVIWAWMYQKKWTKAVIFMISVTPLIMILFNPRWWINPIVDIQNYLTLSMNRSLFIPIPTYYLGSTYEFALPWHHPPVMLMATLPPLILIAIVLGVASRNIKKQETMFFLLPALAYLASFQLPNAPGHDGVRLFMPIFPFLAILGGLGVARLMELIAGYLEKREWLPMLTRNRIAGFLLTLFILPSTFALVNIHPYELEYYSSLVGGIRGAHRLGFETTYWLDVLNKETLADINKVLPKDARLEGMFPHYGCEHLTFLKFQNQFRQDIQISQKETRYYILPSRQGMFMDLDWILYRYDTPIYKKDLKGVKLLAVHDSKGMGDRILASVEKHLQEIPDDPQTNYDMGVILTKAGKHGYAVEHFRKALPLESKLKSVHIRLGEALAESGNYTEAEKELKIAIEKYPDSPKPFIVLAKMYLKARKLNLAEKYFKAALERRVNDMEALRGLSDIKTIRSNWKPGE